MWTFVSKMVSLHFNTLSRFVIAFLSRKDDVLSKMYSAYKLNKQGDNIQPCHTPFPIRNQSIVPCPVLTAAS